MSSSAFILLSCLGLFCRLVASRPAAAVYTCQKTTASIAFAALLEDKQCPTHRYVEDIVITSRVLEIDGHDMDTILKAHLNDNDNYVAVLFYANWCPFSTAARRTFDSLSVSFPSIYHLAIESSSLWPSSLAKHGVRSFPAFILYNKSSDIRFYGHRTFKSISQFYTNHTGFLSLCLSDADEEKVQSRDPSHVNLPVWLRANIYLLFATLFLILRLFSYVLPKMMLFIKYCRALKGTARQSHKRSLRQGQSIDREQRRTLSKRVLNVSKDKSLVRDETKEASKAVLSMSGWSSSPLAAVTLAENSNRGVGIEECHENGYGLRSHIWG